MTDLTPEPDDEVVSAFLDGEATADERARVEGDPAARRRLAELRAVRDRIAAPVTVPADVRERAVAAALAQFDTQGSVDDGIGAGPGPSSTAPDELAARRTRADGAGRRGRFLAAAAAIVVLVLGAAAVLRVANPPSETSVASSSQLADEQAPPDAVAGGALEGATENDGAPTTTAPGTDDLSSPAPPPTTPAPAAGSGRAADANIVDLGAVSTSRELRDRMLDVIDRASADATASAPSATTGGPPFESSAYASCPSYVGAVDDELGPLLATGVATYQGQPAAILAFAIDPIAHPAANGTIRIYAVTANDCAPLAVLTTR